MNTYISYPYIYINNTNTDVRAFHDAIMAACENGGQLPDELADMFTLTKLPDWAKYGWRLDPAEDAPQTLTQQRDALLAAAKAAKAVLVGELNEPGRSAFWQLVDAIAKAEGAHQ